MQCWQQAVPGTMHTRCAGALLPFLPQAGFPLTHPELSKAFVVTSAHDTEAMDWAALSVRAGPGWQLRAGRRARMLRRRQHSTVRYVTECCCCSFFCL